MRQGTHGPRSVPGMRITQVRQQLLSKRVKHHVQHVRVIVSVAAFRKVKVYLRLSVFPAQPEPCMPHAGEQRRARTNPGLPVLKPCPGIVYGYRPPVRVPESLENPPATFDVGEFANRIQFVEAPAVFRIQITRGIGVSGQGVKHAQQACQCISMITRGALTPESVRRESSEQAVRASHRAVNQRRLPQHTAGHRISLVGFRAGIGVQKPVEGVLPDSSPEKTRPRCGGRHPRPVLPGVAPVRRLPGLNRTRRSVRSGFRRSANLPTSRRGVGRADSYTPALLSSPHPPQTRNPG